MTAEPNPIQHFIPVWYANEKQVMEDLHSAAEDIQKIIKKSESLPKITGSAANLRLAQYRVNLQEIRYTMREMWIGQLGPTMAKGIQLAAEEAGGLPVLSGALAEATGVSPLYWEQSMRQKARLNMEAYRQRVEGNSYVPLSTRVYRNAELANGAVDKVVTNALISGKSAKELAKDVYNLISPDVKGGISYAAMRLGRTELNNAFHAVTIAHHGKNPWVTGMTWHTSGSHPKPDICDSYNGKTYDIDETPAKPHPQCLCYVTPETLTEAQFAKRFKKGDFDDQINELLNPSDSGIVIAPPKSTYVPKAKKIAPATKAPAPTPKPKLKLAEMASAKPTDITKVPPVSRTETSVYHEMKHLEAAQWQQERDYTPKELGSLRAYSGSDYQAINSLLRKGEKSPYFGARQVIDDHVKNLDSMMRPLPRDMILNRYMKPTTKITEGKTVADLEAGDLFMDRAFLSTGIEDNEKIKIFGSVKFIIQAAKGSTKGAYLENHTRVPGEHEVLLARETKLRVISVKPGDSFRSPRTITVRIEE